MMQVIYICASFSCQSSTDVLAGNVRRSKLFLKCPFSHMNFFFTLVSWVILLKFSKYHFPITVLTDPSSVLLSLELFTRLWVMWECGWLQIFRLFLTRVNWGICHGYIFNNEHAHHAQSMIFMLTDKFCKFVLGFYSIKYWMDLH